MGSLEAVGEGVLHLENGKLHVRATYPNKKVPKSYWVNQSLLHPAGLPVDQLEGARALVTWNLSDGAITRVEVVLPDPEGPTSLASQDGSSQCFLNPYAFVSLPDRDEACLPEALTDRPPAGHDRYDPDRWTGTIALTITTTTPLIIPDHARAAADAKGDQQTPPPLPVRVDHLGRPILSGSAIKGMLRSAYEAITNSRLGVFTGHDERLAIRATVEGALTLKPAWVSAVDGDSVTVTWVDSLSAEGDHSADRAPQPAVWVPRRLACANSHRCQGAKCSRPSGTHCAEPRGRVVEAWMLLAQLGKFPVWWVISYAEPGRLGSLQRSKVKLPKSLRQSGEYFVKVRGRLHWTCGTFPAGGDKKQHERLVVEEVLEGPATVVHRSIRLTREMIDGWRAVIDSYARAHEDETDAERTHRYARYVTEPTRWRELRLGDTLYVDVDDSVGTDDTPRVRLYPSMIGRKPFPGAPSASLPATHHPSTDRGKLSPAERVFGWVRQGADDSGVAYRGHVRLLPPDDEGIPGPDSIQQFAVPVRLATLSSPKPSQFRFYLGDARGMPLAVRKTPEEGYPAQEGTVTRRLRGRKVYLTHAEVLTGVGGADTYWDPQDASKPVTVGGRKRFREYLAHRDAKPQVTTTICGWVKPNTRFRTTLVVDNLDPVELGALLWLLSLPKGAMLKLGLGKPLGFGAVRVDVDWARTRLYTGEELLNRYRVVSRDPAPTDIAKVQQLARDYDDVLRRYLPDVRTEFLHAARGFVDIPVHYPRCADEASSERGFSAPSTPRATTYDWWVANDKLGDKARVVGTLSDPSSLRLPYLRPNSKDDTQRKK